ncbi:hypothetical protein [Synechococcus sp. PCC 7336]|uniref:hypothetical protein n=1 Tax=Synechococcus sp. PCC 7336 TaxID=195250 RepID=UPI000347A05A|nr:hypothetical protein [Synechococcus sp. PCC 7336]
MKRLLLDAGPLIALFHAKDRDHQVCLTGFQQLIAQKTEMLAPHPIVYEVHKWFMHNAAPRDARKALTGMEQSVRFLYVDDVIFQSVTHLQTSLIDWAGTLEDATVAVMALHYRCPVWTLKLAAALTRIHVETWSFQALHSAP